MEIWRLLLTKNKKEPAKPCPDFSLDELIRALEDKGGGDEQGYFTTQELCERVGHGVGWVRLRLKEMDREGRIQFAKRKTLTLDRKPVRVPAYKLKETKKD